MKRLRWMIVLWFSGTAGVLFLTSSCSRKSAPPLEEIAQHAQALSPGSAFGAACTSAATCGTNGACDPEDHICVCQAPAIFCGGACVNLDSDAAHCGSCQTACGGSLVCDQGRCAASVTPRPKRAVVGAACSADTTCATGSSCVSGTCACDAGKIACKGGCVDIETDPNSCGGCGFVCLHDRCEAGHCVAGPPPPTAFAAVTHVAPIATNVCRHETEAYPERSINTGDIFAPYTWSDGGSSVPQIHVNATDGGSSSDAGLAWGTDDTLQEPGATGYTAFADSWSTSDSTIDGGLELFVSLVEDGSGNEFVGLAGTTMAHLHTPGSWDNKAEPLDDDAGHSLGYDGPSAVFDNSAGRFWAIAAADVPNRPRVWWTTSGCAQFPNSCTMHWDTLTQAADAGHGDFDNGGSHYSIALHLVNSDAMIAFHDASDRIRLVIVAPHTPELTIVSDTVIDSNAPYEPNTNCPIPGSMTVKNCPTSNDGHICRCGDITQHDCQASGQDECSRLGGKKVHIIGRTYSDHPLAILAYDTSFSDGTNLRFKSHLQIWDVTDPTLPSFVAHWVTTPSGGAQTWSSVVSGGGGTDYLGWFMYQNDGDPCSSSFLGKLSDADGYLLGTWTTGTIASGFPVVVSDRSNGTGDYIGGVRRGLANGHPFATFSHPVVTDAGCLSCQDASYSIETEGAEVTP